MQIMAVFPFPRDPRCWVTSGLACQLDRLILSNADFARCPLVDNIRRFCHVKVSHLQSQYRATFALDSIDIEESIAIEDGSSLVINK